MEKREARKDKQFSAPNRYEDIPDGSRNSVFLTMEQEAFSDFRRNVAGRNREAWSLFSEARVGRKTSDDHVVQLFYSWYDLLWNETDPVIVAFMQGLADLKEPYQFVRLGEEFGQIVHVYANGFDDTDLEGFQIVQSAVW